MSPPRPDELLARPAWATVFYTRMWAEQASEAPALVGHLTALRDRQARAIDSQVAPGAKSAAGLYESHFDLFADPHPGVQKLVAFIRGTLAQAVVHVNGSELRPEDLDVEFADSWYHITNAGGFHDAHVHNGCSWCGIFYLQVGESGATAAGSAPNGGSRFYSPLNVGGGYRDYGNKYLTASLDPPIRDGLLLLFPSYLLHSGLPYSGAEDRVVIAFNARAFVTPAAAKTLGRGRPS